LIIDNTQVRQTLAAALENVKGRPSTLLHR
jgi:hypothetical protein